VAKPKGLPESVRDWDVPAKLTDYQLKMSLNYLNSVANRGACTPVKASNETR
jgi:carboxyl-terminal processing protease